jgi:NADH-quinone oxidoreductase subunit M
MFPILSTIVFLPLLGSIAVLLVPARLRDVIRWIALGAALLDVLFVFALALTYSQANLAASSSSIGAAFSSTFLSSVGEQVPLVAGGALTLNYSLGVDGISLLLVALTSLLSLVCLAASWRVEQRTKHYMAFMLLLESGMLGVFLATNLFLFYIFWPGGASAALLPPSSLCSTPLWAVYSCWRGLSRWATITSRQPVAPIPWISLL